MKALVMSISRESSDAQLQESDGICTYFSTKLIPLIVIIAVTHVRTRK